MVLERRFIANGYFCLTSAYIGRSVHADVTLILLAACEAQAVLISQGDTAIIATTNVKHLARFTSAQN
jgi:hypothetical protein